MKHRWRRFLTPWSRRFLTMYLNLLYVPVAGSVINYLDCVPAYSLPQYVSRGDISSSIATSFVELYKARPDQLVLLSNPEFKCYQDYHLPIAVLSGLLVPLYVLVPSNQLSVAV